MAATTPKPYKVLFHLHPRLDTLDFTGPLEVLSQAIYPSTKSLPTPIRVFEPTVTAGKEQVTSGQNCIFQRHIPLVEAYARLTEFDVLVIPGGGVDGVLEAQSEPLDLIRAWCALEKEEGRVRTLLSVCTGSLFLAQAGALKGLTATTHPYSYEKLPKLCDGQATVVKERYVVNKVNENGLRVITSGGVSCGLDACMWLINEVAGKECVDKVLEIVQYAWREGIVV
jgi:transcriptional regulator GlxA family with amidase domain